MHRLHTDLFAFTPPCFPQPTASPGPLFLQHLSGNSHCPQGQYFWVKPNRKALQPSSWWKTSVPSSAAGTQAAGESWVSLACRYDGTARLRGTARATTARCRAAHTIPLACSRHPSPWRQAWAAAFCRPLPHGACTAGAGAAQQGCEPQGCRAPRSRSANAAAPRSSLAAAAGRGFLTCGQQAAPHVIPPPRLHLRSAALCHPD